MNVRAFPGRPKRTMRRATKRVGAAVVATGVGVGVVVGALSGGSPYAFPAIDQAALARADAAFAKAAEAAVAKNLPFPLALRAARARALVLVAGRRYRLVGARPPRLYPGGWTGGWTSLFGRIESGVYAAPDVRGARLFDLLTEYSGDAPRTVLVRLVADRPPSAPEPPLVADAEFSAHPPPSTPLLPPGVVRTLVLPPPRLLACALGREEEPPPDPRPLAREAGAFPILVDGGVRDEPGIAILPLSDPNETVRTCRVGPLGAPPPLPARGRTSVPASRSVWYSQDAPGVGMTVPHPLSAFLSARLGREVTPLPSRIHYGATTSWTGLALTDRYEAAGGGWRYVGTVVASGTSLGRKSATPDLARTMGVPADGTPKEWAIANDLVAEGAVAPP